MVDPSSATTSDAEPASSIGLYINNGRGVLLAVIQPGTTVSTHDGLLINVIDGDDAAVTQLGTVHSVNPNDGTVIPVLVLQFGTTVSVHVVPKLTVGVDAAVVQVGTVVSVRPELAEIVGVEEAVKHAGMIASAYARATNGMLDAVVLVGTTVSVHATLLTLPTLGVLAAVVHDGTTD